MVGLGKDAEEKPTRKRKASLGKNADIQYIG